MTDRAVRVAAAAVGVAAVTQAAVLLVAPDAAGTVIPVGTIADSTALSHAGTRALAFGLLGTGCLAWVASSSRPAPAEPPARQPAFPARYGAGEDGDVGTVGARFDRDLRDTLSAAAERDDRDVVRADLRALAIDAVAHAEDVSGHAARQLVDDGEWTDDRIAAAYLGDPATTAALSRRLDATIRPRTAKRRRIERSVAAVESLLGGGRR